jgi:hypothetical protein
MCTAHVEVTAPGQASGGVLVVHDVMDRARPAGSCFVCGHVGLFRASLTKSPHIGMCAVCHEAASHAVSRL